ncbi:hypothetical protein [Paenibacillus periandrae]|uniref:hypothetical protein n=1 Tax=Paenibacillus periandrae TaxID=1761741 RepID=UPI001F091B5B|nr:hypothetical protein [Paenibacillus periandrae]
MNVFDAAEDIKNELKEAIVVLTDGGFYLAANVLERRLAQYETTEDEIKRHLV